MPRQIQNFSICLGNASAKKVVEDLAETFVYHIGNSFGILRHFSKDEDLVFLTVDTTYSTYIILFDYNTLKRKKQKTIFLPLFTLFWFLCVSLRLEKPGAQNKTVCENQGRQHELSDHRK